MERHSKHSRNIRDNQKRIMKINKCYVVHYTKLKERKEFLDPQLQSLGLEARYITSFDKEDLSHFAVDAFYEKNREAHDAKIEKLWDSSVHTYRELHEAEISCTLKHFEALHQIAQSEDDYGLILEDDVVFSGEFSNSFDKFLSETPLDWDAIFICLNKHLNN